MFKMTLSELILFVTQWTILITRAGSIRTHFLRGPIVTLFNAKGPCRPIKVPYVKDTPTLSDLGFNERVCLYNFLRLEKGLGTTCCPRTVSNIALTIYLSICEWNIKDLRVTITILIILIINVNNGRLLCHFVIRSYVLMTTLLGCV